MSRSKVPRRERLRVPIADFQYRQMDLPPTPPPVQEEPVVEKMRPLEVQMTEAALAERLAEERSLGFAEAETRLRNEFQQRAERETAKILAVIADFEHTRKEYFSRVEAEVVQLALTIAAKILHRESQVDPLLVAALVQIALGQLKEGAAAVIRVPSAEKERWRAYFAASAMSTAVTIIEDGELQRGDCVLETEMGTVNFSLTAQLKEVEQGFLDVLAQKPQA